MDVDFGTPTTVATEHVWSSEGDEWFEIGRGIMTLNMKETPVSVGWVMWANSKKEVSWTFDDLPNATDSVGDWVVVHVAGTEPIYRNVEVPDEHEPQVSETGCYVYMKNERRYIHTPAAVSNFGRLVDSYMQYVGLLPDSGWHPIGIGLVLPLKFQFFAYTNALHQVGFVVARQIGTEGTGGQPIGITLKWLTAEPEFDDTHIINEGDESVKGKETETGCYLIVSREKRLGVYVPAGTEEIGLLIHPSARYLGVKKEANGDWSQGSVQRVVCEEPAKVAEVELSHTEPYALGHVWTDQFGNLSLYCPHDLSQMEYDQASAYNSSEYKAVKLDLHGVGTITTVPRPSERDDCSTGPPNDNGCYIDDYFHDGVYQYSYLVIPNDCSGRVGWVKFPWVKLMRNSL